jgi:APA family basic amino acid/polyamine antiporter
MSIQPKLGKWDLTMIVINLVIGVGIFRSPQMVAKDAQILPIFFAAWVIGGIVSFCGALTFAEIGARYPSAGGFYKLFSHCYTPAFAFMLNWVLLINNAASCTGVAIMGAEYISPILLPAAWQNQNGITFLVLFVMLSLYVVNLLGIRAGANTQNALSIIKIAMILLFCCALFMPSSPQVETNISIPSLNWRESMLAFGTSLIAIFFSYGGYQQIINFGSDVKEPGKNIPKAIFMGILVVVVLYLTLNLAYYHILGFSGIQKSDLLAAEIGKALFGAAGGKAASILLFVSIVAFLNATIMANPRMYYAMAEDKVLPDIFKKVHERTQTQYFALSFFMFLTLATYFFAKTFDNILRYVMFIDTISIATAAYALFLLRKKMKTEEHAYQGYKIRFYPLIPIVFITMILICTLSLVYTEPQKCLVATGLFLLGYPLYRIFKRA